MEEVSICMPPCPLSIRVGVRRSSKVGDVVTRVVRSLPNNEDIDETRYGLFLPIMPCLPSEDAPVEMPGVWMKHNLLLSSYDLTPEDTLWLRPCSLDLSSSQASCISYYSVIICPLQELLLKNKFPEETSMSDAKLSLAQKHDILAEYCLDSWFCFGTMQTADNRCFHQFSAQSPLADVTRWFHGEGSHQSLYLREPQRVSDPIINLGPGGKAISVHIPHARLWKTLYFEDRATVYDAIIALLAGTPSSHLNFGLHLQQKPGIEHQAPFADLQQADQGLLRLQPESEILASFELSNATHLVLLEQAPGDSGEARYDVVELFFDETVTQAIRRIQRHRLLLRNTNFKAPKASPAGAGDLSKESYESVFKSTAPASVRPLAAAAALLSSSLPTYMVPSPPRSPAAFESPPSPCQEIEDPPLDLDFCLFLPASSAIGDFSRWLEPSKPLAEYAAYLSSARHLELRPRPLSRKLVVIDGIDYRLHIHLSPSLSRADDASMFMMYDDRVTVHQAEIVLAHSIRNRAVDTSSYGLYLKTFSDLEALEQDLAVEERSNAHHLLIRAEKPSGPSSAPPDAGLDLEPRAAAAGLRVERTPVTNSLGDSLSNPMFSQSLPSVASSSVAIRSRLYGRLQNDPSDGANFPPPSLTNTPATPPAPLLRASSQINSPQAPDAIKPLVIHKQKKIWLNRDWKLTQYQIGPTDILTLKPRPTMVRLQEMMAAFTDLVQRPDLIANEKILLKDDHVIVPGRRDHQTLGSLICTNYQLIFLPHSRSTYDEAVNLPNIHIPLANISRLTEVGGGGRTRGIEILSKDFRQMLFGFGHQSNKQRCHNFFSTISERAFPVDRHGLRKGHERLFAFASDEGYSRRESREDGWMLYDPRADYARVGLCGTQETEQIWRIVPNVRYELVPTYPSAFIMPRQISMAEIQKIAEFRIMRRVPATTWRHPNGATLTRCAQPAAGLGIQRCAPDENLVRALIANNVNGNVLYIVDLRPVAVAMGHSVLGAGSERATSYAGCKLKFMGIGNIHQMSDSCRKLQSLCGFELEAPNWYALLSGSLWLNHISLILQAAITISDWMDRHGCSVLIHCSDGWDRTAQVSALTQLLLDPFYRTSRGFMILVEKEWLSFGHKFAQRHSHGAKPQAQTSPIFMQFLDAVYQLTEQHPSAFEFNGDFLMEFVDHSYSCRFGTFLFNSEKERFDSRVSERTASFWSYLNHNSRRFLNPLCLLKSSQATRQSVSTSDLGVLEPTSLAHSHRTQLLRICPTVANLRLWRQCYLRWNMGYLPSLNKEREYSKIVQQYMALDGQDRDRK